MTIQHALPVPGDLATAPRKALIVRMTLAAAGALLGFVGGPLLLDPLGFYGTDPRLIGAPPLVMNDLRASGGLFALTGALMIASAALRRHIEAAVSIGALLYLSYAVSRGLGFLLGDEASAAAQGAAIVEAALGVVLFFAWRLVRREPISRAP